VSCIAIVQHDIDLTEKMYRYMFSLLRNVFCPTLYMKCIGMVCVKLHVYRIRIRIRKKNLWILIQIRIKQIILIRNTAWRIQCRIIAKTFAFRINFTENLKTSISTHSINTTRSSTVFFKIDSWHF
jgi:hypothetical protein